MKPLSIWLARRKRRRAARKLMRQFITGIERYVVFERQLWESTMEFCDMDFAALWTNYALSLGKGVEQLTIDEKRQALLNYVLRE